jgi:hypothetical protein
VRFTRAVAATLFMLMIGSLSMLQAQTDAACPMEGPSIADTLGYISNALANSGPSDPFGQQIYTTLQISVPPGGTQLVLRSFRTSERLEVSNELYIEQTVPIKAASCIVDIGSGGSPGSETPQLSVRCQNHADCITSRGWKTTHNSVALLFLNMPNEQVEHLQRALSHLIALLQRQYKETHIDTDPFGK